MSRIREDYINTGQVRFTYKHFAVLGPQSVRAAEASECAADQDQFWPYHDRLFEDLMAGDSNFTDARLVEIAGELGLDTTAFETCLTSGQYSELVSVESLTIQQLGVRGTPGFLINGVFISGAQPYEVFQQVIEEALAQAQ